MKYTTDFTTTIEAHKWDGNIIIQIDDLTQGVAEIILTPKLALKLAKQLRGIVKIIERPEEQA